MSRTHTVLVVEDHETTRESLREILERDGCEVLTAATVGEAQKRALEPDIDVVLTDLRLPDSGDRGGLEVLERSRKADPGRPVILLTAHGSVDTAVEAMKKGAHDYLEKPLDLRRLRQVLEGAFRVRDLEVRNQELSRQLAQAGGPHEMVGESAGMQQLRDDVARVARTNSTVLITGESGSGKELVANALHRGSTRNQGALIKVHLGALPKELIESELFGHERGAFTGAVKRKLGRFELADGGTLFLDEIAEMPAETQVKLLRVLETKQFERLGGTRTITADVRFVAATHQDLKAMVTEGRFREDLYFRINVVSVLVPPLRDRSGDVKLLVGAFASQFVDSQGRTKEFDEEAVAAMERYAWPGNVRELRNVIERLAVIVTGPVVGVADLPQEIREAAGVAGVQGASTGVEGPLLLRDLEKDAIRRALVETKGVKKQAAKLLGIGVRTLYRKMSEYEIG